MLSTKPCVFLVVESYLYKQVDGGCPMGLSRTTFESRPGHTGTRVSTEKPFSMGKVIPLVLNSPEIDRGSGRIAHQTPNAGCFKGKES